MYDFNWHVKEWSSPPVDDVGYIASSKLLALPDEELKQLIEQMEKTRYHGDRNYQNKWREYLGLDTTHGKTVLDFGCGVGIESLQFAKSNNTVIALDISPLNTRLASRVLKLFGYKIENGSVTDYYPYFHQDLRYDVFYANGVLHHIPYAEDILRRAVEGLNPNGEIRLMLYSDRGWAKYTNSPVPSVEEDVTNNSAFMTFVRVFDSVGGYADWYNEEKLIYRFGSFLSLKSFNYITNDDRYCVAVLEVK